MHRMMFRTYDDWKTTDPNDDMRDYCGRCKRCTRSSELWLVDRVWMCDDCRRDYERGEEDDE